MHADAQHAEISKAAPTGRVTLVGAGPGAADLLTHRGVQAIAHADVIVADGLVGEDIKALSSPNSRWINAAKRVGDPVMTQSEIIERLLSEARAGNRVVRLKGGDVGLFGRGGEEVAAVVANGIPFDIVPGVTAASAAAATAGFSLTHRDLASSVTFMTGHTKDGQVPELEGVKGSDQTLVVYMGLTNARLLSGALIDKGFAPSTPVAIIENASLENERVFYGTLRSLSDLIAAQNIQSPALIVVGDVVRTAQGWWRCEKNSNTPADPGHVHFAHG